MGNLSRQHLFLLGGAQAGAEGAANVKIVEVLRCLSGLYGCL